MFKIQMFETYEVKIFWEFGHLKLGIVSSFDIRFSDLTKEWWNDP
jgi:hypothetical protein